MATVEKQTFLKVLIPDDDAEDESALDALSAIPVQDHYAKGEVLTRWVVGHECSGTSVIVYSEDIDSWIELFQAMKEYKEESK